MDNQENNSSDWYKYTLLNIIYCFVFLPLGLLAFWKNGSRFPTYFFSVIIGALLILAIYNEIKPKQPIQPTISGLDYLNFSNLLMAMEESGYSVESNITTDLEWRASMNKSENSFEMMVYPMDGSAIEKIEVMATNESEDREEIRLFLDQILSFNYESSNPELAKEWLNENIGQVQQETIIGKVKFTLRNSNSTTVFTMVGIN